MGGGAQPYQRKPIVLSCLKDAKETFFFWLTEAICSNKLLYFALQGHSLNLDTYNTCFRKFFKELSIICLLIAQQESFH